MRIEIIEPLVCALTSKTIFESSIKKGIYQFDKLNRFHFYKSLNFHMLISDITLNGGKLARSAYSLCRSGRILALNVEQHTCTTERHKL